MQLFTPNFKLYSVLLATETNGVCTSGQTNCDEINFKFGNNKMGIHVFLLIVGIDNA